MKNYELTTPEELKEIHKERKKKFFEALRLLTYLANRQETEELGKAVDKIIRRCLSDIENGEISCDEYDLLEYLDALNEFIELSQDFNEE